MTEPHIEETPIERLREKTKLALAVNRNVVDAQKRSAERGHRTANEVLAFLHNETLQEIGGK